MRRRTGVIALLALAAAGCGGAAKPRARDATGRPDGVALQAGRGSRPVPDRRDDDDRGRQRLAPRPDSRPATKSRFDCFYVYPTVSLQKAANANLKIQPPETATAVEQASRFSQVCRVWAPMYRQQTVAGLLDLTSYATTTGIAFRSLLSGWQNYLRYENHGRPSS